MPIRKRFESLLVLLVLFSAHPVFATVVEPNFSETSVATLPTAMGSDGITGIAWAPDGSNRLFVIQKAGSVRIIKDGALLPTPFTQMAVATCGECGLIGIAFDPSFASNHLVYFFRSVEERRQQIVRYVVNGDVAGPASTVIIDNLPGNTNHNGGGIGFGADGKLYWSIGDTGGHGVDDDLDSLASKVGRSNLDGSAPADNPFFSDDNTTQPRDFIWARGFRNPFTMTFQPGTGKLWLNVVGSSTSVGYEQVFVVGERDHGGWIAYENTQPDGYLKPVIAYGTNRVDTRTLTAASRSGNVATFTTSVAHLFRRGAKITIAGTGTMDGDVFVASVPSATVFTASQTGPDVTASSGTASTQDLGGSITGGCFYEGTAFPAEYRGNFFFGDYNSGRMMRVRVDGSNNIVSVDQFARIPLYIDCATGPDGALYYAGIGGAVYRAMPTGAPVQQSLILSRTSLSLTEGGTGTFTVSLATQPAGPVEVTSAASGDASITVTGGGTLSFGTGNWSTPQTVTVTAAEDADTTNDTATITVSSPSLTSQTVAVSATDNDTITFQLSSNSLTLSEGGTTSFTVRLSAQPASDVTVTLSKTGHSSISITSPTTLTFTPTDWNMTQTVSIAAASPDGDTINNTATVTLTASGIPTRNVSITSQDIDPVPPVITSTAITSGVVDALYQYDVQATGNPAPTYSVSGPSGMTINASTGLLSWTPTAAGTFPVTVTAQNGQGSVMQAFSLMIRGDAPPTCSLTAPHEGDLIEGANAEFFGDGNDDVAPEKGEFYVDGQLEFTDFSGGGHFHYGGAHLLFDTTHLANGSHTLMMKVYDAKGQSCQVSRTVTVSNVGSPDGGAPPPPDGGAPSPDGGANATGTLGSGCATGGGFAPVGSALLLLLALVGLRRPRRRRSSERI